MLCSTPAHPQFHFEERQRQKPRVVLPGNFSLACFITIQDIVLGPVREFEAFGVYNAPKGAASSAQTNC